jgi:hypothetical protein
MGEPTRFDHVTLTPEQQELSDDVRGAYQDLERYLEEVIPNGRDKALLFTHLEDSSFRAQRAISRG